MADTRWIVGPPVSRTDGSRSHPAALDNSAPALAENIRPPTGKHLLIGFVGGMFSGALGVGGGIVMVPLLVGFLALAQRHAHAVSLGAIVPISLVGLLPYGLAGSVHGGAGLALGAGGIVGARGGARLLVVTPERALKLGFGLLMCVAAGLLVLRP